MPPDEPTSEEQLEQLPEDNDTPFRPAEPTLDDSVNTPTQQHLDDTHPATDTGIDSDELYQEGITGASGVSEPSVPPGDDEPVDDTSAEPTG